MMEVVQMLLLDLELLLMALLEGLGVGVTVR
jgi:hypothetical protein